MRDHPDGPYSEAMTVSVHDVARELRARHPGLPTMKLHKLLYYCQGHHLATFGEPLFDEPISAWDKGPVVSDLWRHDRYGDAEEPTAIELTEAQLNTVGYVLHRYGGLSGADLSTLTHSQDPWRLANEERLRHPRRDHIELEWIRDDFRSREAADAAEDDVPQPEPAVLREWLSGAQPPRLEDLGQPDTIEDLRARLA